MCRQKTRGISACLSGFLLALFGFAQWISPARAGTFLSFQEGDLRIGTNAAVGTNGTLLSSTYTVGATVLRSDFPASSEQGSQLLAGNNGTATNRILLSFDLSYLTNIVGTNFARIDSTALVLTHQTNAGAGSSSVQAVYKSLPFNETTATWAEPGSGAPAGGFMGLLLRERSAIGSLITPETEVWGSPNEFWGEDSGSGSDMLAEAVRQTLAGGSHTLCLMVRRKTEQQNNYYSRYVQDDDARLDYRPELLVGIDSFSFPPFASSNYSILSFAEEFNGNSLDTNAWMIGTFDPYRTNVSVANGFLALTTRQVGTNWRAGLLETREYASKYGWYEARLKLNGASGLNNAFWLNTPNEIQVTENTFDRTEIDITEAHHAHNDSHMTVHDWAPEHISPFASIFTMPDISQEFHDVGLEWTTDNSLVFYWDGVPRGFVTPSKFLGMDTMIPLSVLFSTKVLSWAGEPEAGLDGSQMLVDYVRVRQKPGWLGATSGTWNVPSNWGIDGVPGIGQAAVFNSPSAHATITLAAPTFCHSLYFDNTDCPAFTFDAGAFCLHLGAAETGLGGVTINTPVTNSQVLNVSVVAERNLQLGNFSRDARTVLRLNGGLDAVTNDIEIQLCGFAPVEICGSISTNVSRVIKWGENKGLLAGTNAHSGKTEVRKGTLIVSSPDALGKNGPGAETIVTSGASLLLADGLVYDSPETLILSGSGAPGSGGVLNLANGGNASFYGPVVMASNVTLACNPAGGTLTLGGPVSGAFDLLKSGPGVVELSGSNSFSGLVTVQEGSILVSNSKALGSTASGTLIENTGQLCVRKGLTNGEPLQLQGASSGIIHLRNLDGTNVLSGAIQLLGGGYNFGISSESGSLHLGGSIAFADAYSGGRTCLLSGAGTGIISGPVLNGQNAPVALSKSGAGQWVLTGTNGYTSPTTISGGSLLINGSSRSAITLQDGSFGGSGIISNNVTIAGGRHEPGNPFGVQTIRGSYVLSSPGRLRLRIGGTQDQQSRLLSRGGGSSTVSLAGVLELSARPGLQTNSTFIVIDNDGADTVIGTFAGRPNNATFTAAGYIWQVNYNGGDGNDVTLTVVSALKPTVSGIRSANASLILSWPEWAGDYQLQTASNLHSPVLWTPVANIALASNDTLNVEIPATDAHGFFRLEYP